ncbi:uncharacterized protein [Dipodomys merriami]|uniref:uncharacterized protein n=1 Tax=Dipodomys merriami TaxID=94247 RepID=UPI003855F908
MQLLPLLSPEVYYPDQPRPAENRIPVWSRENLYNLWQMCMMTHGTLLRGVEYQAPAPLHSYGSLDHMEALCSSQEALPVTRCFVAGWHPYLDLLSLDWLHTPSPYGCKCGLLMPIWSCPTGCSPMQLLLQFCSPVVFRPDQPRPTFTQDMGQDNRSWTSIANSKDIRCQCWSLLWGVEYQAPAPLHSYGSLYHMEAMCSSQEALPVTRCFVAGWHPYLDLLSLDWYHIPSPNGRKCGLLMPIWSSPTGCSPMQLLLQLLNPVVFRTDQPTFTQDIDQDNHSWTSISNSKDIRCQCWSLLWAENRIPVWSRVNLYNLWQMCMMTHGTSLQGVEYPLHSYGSLDHMEALCSSQEALPVTRCFVAGWHPYLDLLSLDWLHTPSPYGCKCGLLIPIGSCPTGCSAMRLLLPLLSPVVFRPDRPSPTFTQDIDQDDRSWISISNSKDIRCQCWSLLWAENRMLVWTTEDSYGNVWKIWMMTHGTSSQGFGYQALAPLRSHRSLGPMEALCSSQEALPVTRPEPHYYIALPHAGKAWLHLDIWNSPMEMPTPALPFQLHNLEPTNAEAAAAGPAPAPAVLTSADFTPPMPLARPTASMTNAPSSQMPLHTTPQ